MNASTTTILQNIVRRLSRSLLQYVRDAFPWTRNGDQERLESLQKLISEEEQAIAQLSNLLRRRRIPVPYLGPYPQHFTNINYISLDHLIPYLIAHQKAEIVQLERDEVKLWDDPEAREQAQRILDLARRHLQALEKMTLVQARQVPLASDYRVVGLSHSPPSPGPKTL